MVPLIGNHPSFSTDDSVEIIQLFQSLSPHLITDLAYVLKNDVFRSKGHLRKTPRTTSDAEMLNRDYLCT